MRDEEGKKKGVNRRAVWRKTGKGRPGGRGIGEGRK